MVRDLGFNPQGSGIESPKVEAKRSDFYKVSKNINAAYINAISQTKADTENPYSDLDLRYKSVLGFNLIPICIRFYEGMYFAKEYMYSLNQVNGVY